ncbi:MAG: hypothetical protein ACUVV3_03005 [Dehalococcoidia bacterium]
MLRREVMNMVRGQAANTRITVDLGSAALYRSVKVLAAYQGRPLREIVAEALREWLEKQEELEDLQDFLAAEGEPQRPLREIMAELGE